CGVSLAISCSAWFKVRGLLKESLNLVISQALDKGPVKRASHTISGVVVLLQMTRDVFGLSRSARFQIAI
ncbi:MAG TPA: hypothetical protein VE177_05260, partial [Candidatus Binatus sp.]|nr:hypothetical protein [Candidatus Binatus sp.]